MLMIIDGFPSSEEFGHFKADRLLWPVLLGNLKVCNLQIVTLMLPLEVNQQIFTIQLIENLSYADEFGLPIVSHLSDLISSVVRRFSLG